MNNFEKACALSCEEWVNSLPDEIQPYEFSRQHNRKMNRLFSKMRNNKYHRFTKNAIKLLVAAAIILSIAATAFAIPQSREYIIRNLFNYSSYTISNTDHSVKVSDLKVGYVPDGFELVSILKDENIHMFEYKNNGKFIVINKSFIGNKINFDTEKFEYEKILINNIEYNLYQTKSDTYGIVWNNGLYTFDIDSNVSKDEMLKIAESIE